MPERYAAIGALLLFLRQASPLQLDRPNLPDLFFQAKGDYPTMARGKWKDQGIDILQEQSSQVTGRGGG